MRLAEYTDYTLRVLMYCASQPGRLITIAELAERHAVSKNHLMKVVNDLARQGLLETTRGRGGGLRLSMSPASIRVGDVVRRCETDFRLVECFDSSTNTCSLTPTCRLKGVLDAALRAYFKELDAATLADITGTETSIGVTAITSSRRAGAGTPMTAPVTRRRTADKTAV
jgi:Rrf2 family nitric oxide-sensitive transcriptional repressor